MQKFHNHGVRFAFPDDWELQEQQPDVDNRNDLVLTVNSPGTAYWSLSLFTGSPDPPRVLNEAIEAFQDEYPEIEINSVIDPDLEYDHEGRDLVFFQYELINYVGLRVFPSGLRTALLMFQGTDHEWPEDSESIHTITASLRVDDGPTVIWPY